MASAVKLIDGLSLRQMVLGGFGTVLYRVDDLPFYDYDAAVRDGAVSGLPNLSDVYDPTAQTLGVSIVVEKQVVQVLSPNRCVVAIRYAPPQGFGTWLRKGSETFSMPQFVSCPNWSIFDATAFQSYRWSPFQRQRTVGVRVETRLMALSSVSAVQRDQMKNTNKLYYFDGLPHLHVGTSTSSDPSGYTRIVSKFTCAGRLPAVDASTPGVAVEIPALDYNDEWTYTPTNDSGVPVIGVKAASELYEEGDPLFWI